jgi:starvation-inducible outer membrane lipoprotein
MNKLLTILMFSVCLLSCCSKTPKESMEATIVAIQKDVSKCYREDSIQTTVRAANGQIASLLNNSTSREAAIKALPSL